MEKSLGLGKEVFEKTQKEILSNQDFLQIGQSLIKTYWTLTNNRDQKIILDYLAAAKNGLSKRLVDFLSRNEPEHINSQLRQLELLEDLPFIKSRNIAVQLANEQQDGLEKKVDERVYFLHDEMYKLAEMQLEPRQIRDLSKEISNWYDLPENKKVDGLKAASLLYRLRDDPMQGYGYFLQQSDAAIRGTKTSLDFSLRDAMEIFVAGTKMPKGSLGDTLRSDVDADIIRAEAPLLEEHLKIDRVTLAIRRLMVRGENALAKEIGDKELERIRRQYEKNPKEFGLDFSEFRLWHGQVTMYAGDHKQALIMCDEASKLAEECKNYILSISISAKNVFYIERLYLILGRLLNNKGYAYWMFEGQYRRAIREFTHAIRFFDEADLKEGKGQYT